MTLTFAKFRSYHFLGSAQHLSLTSRRIRRSSQWFAVCHIFQLFAHVAPHYLQVSDSSGFGSGGASIPVPVFQSSDSSCFNASEQGGIAWVFYNSPIGGLAQCETSQLWWESDRVVGCAHQSIIRYFARPNSFRPSRHVLRVEHPIFIASYQVALSSSSLRVHFLVTMPMAQLPMAQVTMSQAQPSIGLSTWLLGPNSFWSGVMIEGLDPAVLLNTLFLLRRIPPV